MTRARTVSPRTKAAVATATATATAAAAAADAAAARQLRRLKEEIRLYARYRVDEAVARRTADAAGAYTASLNATATWGEIERLLKDMQPRKRARLGGARARAIGEP